MVVMTAKVQKPKLIAVVCLLAAIVCITLVVLSGNGEPTPGTPDLDVSTNEGRIEWLSSCGWTVDAQPVDVQNVRIPEEPDEVLLRYNELQRSQGYDLTRFAGKEVTRYVYSIINYEGAAEPVYATLLVHNGQVIGGDITVTGAGGRMHGFTLPGQANASLPDAENPEETAAEEEAAEPAALTEAPEEAA